MAWNPNKPQLSDRIAESIADIRGNFQAIDGLPQVKDALINNRIVEMGSNSNGEYVRWENGLQVCFARRTTSQVSDVVLSSLWTFPAAFIDANYAVVFGLGDRPKIAGNPDPYTKTLWLHAYARTASYCELRLLVNDWSSVSGDSATFDAVAVGRWK